jgi:hypothetical protein
MALMERLAELRPPHWLAAKRVSSPPLSLSTDQSPYAETDGDDSLDDALSVDARLFPLV